MKEACEILKAPFRASPISTRVAKCGPNLWQMHHLKARDASRGATKGERGFTSIWDRWQNDAIYRKSQLAHDWSDAWVRCLDLTQCAASTKRTNHAQILFTQCWREQTGTTSVAETKVPGSERAIKKFTKRRKEKNSSFHPRQ